MFEDIKDRLEDLLEEFHLNDSDVIGSFVVSKKGFPVSIKFIKEIENALISPMLAAIHSMAERFTDECSIGALKQVVIEGKDIKVIITKAGREHVFCVVLEPSNNLELLPSQF